MIDFAKLKDMREDVDLSQDKMAAILGVKRSTYSLWELGINIIPLKALSNFADFFDVTIDYVIGRSNDRKRTISNKGLDLKVLGNNMKDVRLKNNLSQTDTAKLIGVSQACINKYEKGLICISFSNLFKFATKFNVPIDELCGK